MTNGGRLRIRLAGAIGVLGLLFTLTLPGSPAGAATSSACAGGDFKAALPSGRVVAGKGTYKVGPGELPARSRVQIIGRYVTFDFDVSTLSVYDYALTGAANPDDMTGGVRTPIFASKVADLGTTSVDSGTLEIAFSPNTAVIKRSGSAGTMKLQAKDCATGGIFQMEPSTGTNVTVTHTLAPGIFYFVNPYTGKINFGNGQQLRGKDSPQVANRLSQNETVSVWSVASGGRMGGVLGEDAVELSAGASPCTQDCQARNRIRGSVPVTDPAFKS
jgi:hypothetical protein